MDIFKCHLYSAVLILSLLLSSFAPAVHVDFDGVEIGGGTTQAGYESFRAPGSDTNAALNVTITYTAVLATGEDMTVNMIAQRWKNRSDITGGDTTAVMLHNLLKDFAGPVDKMSAKMSLSLPWGEYEISVYHHESRRSAPEFAGLIITDADGEREEVGLNSGYGSSSASPPCVYTTTIRSDGVNAITFDYDNTDGTTPGAFPINGFDLTGETRPHAINPSPANDSFVVMPDTTLSWSCAPGSADYYDVYFGTDPTFSEGPADINLTELYYDPGPLDTGTVYYWRVDSITESEIITGQVWSFGTAGLASDPVPADGAIRVDTKVELEWSGDVLAASYDVYMDKTDGTTRIANVTEPNMFVRLKNDTTYFWRIAEVDEEGSALGEGVKWSFTTTKNNVVIRLNNEEPIIDRYMEGVDYNINGPSLIRIPDWIGPSERVDPSAVYYLYFANHGGQNIRMAWSTDIEGPYHIYNPGHGVLELNIDVGSLSVFGHIASPDVHVDNENQRIIMYFHGPASWNGNNRSQVTCVATSPFGLDFNSGVVETIPGNFYFRVFEYGGELYAIAKEGEVFKALDPENPWDPSGVDLNTQWYLWDRATTNPFANLGKTVRHNALVVVGDTLHVFYSCYPDMPERILHSTIDLTEDWNYWVASPPDEVLEPELDWEGADLPLTMSHEGSGTGLRELRDPALFEDIDGEKYLLYSGRGEEAIGLAKFFSCCYMPVTGDLSDDCAVGIEDLAELAAGWLKMYDFTDFADMAANWSTY